MAALQTPIQSAAAATPLAALRPAQRSFRMRENHADRDHEKDNTPRDGHRRLGKVHELEERAAERHEQGEDREGDRAFAKDHEAAPSRGHVREHRVHQRHVAEGIEHEDEHDGGGEEFARHSDAMIRARGRCGTRASRPGQASMAGHLAPERRYLAHESKPELEFSRSRGSWLIDSKGRKYVDFLMGCPLQRTHGQLDVAVVQGFRSACQ